jgi:hypothetical protein
MAWQLSHPTSTRWSLTRFSRRVEMDRDGSIDGDGTSGSAHLAPAQETLWRGDPLARTAFVDWLHPSSSRIQCFVRCPAIKQPRRQFQGGAAGLEQAGRASRRDTDDSNPRQGRHQHAPNTTASFNIAYQTYSGMAEPAPVGREVIYCGGKQQPPPGHQWKPSVSSCSCDAIPREPRQRGALNRPRLKIERPTWLTSISNSVHSPTRGTNPFFESRPSLRKHPPSET